LPGRFTGEEKSKRQVLFSTDLIYDVLRQAPARPRAVARRARRCRDGAARYRRLSDMLSRIKGRIVHKELDHVSPLAVPVMLEIGASRFMAKPRTSCWRKPRRPRQRGDGNRT